MSLSTDALTYDEQDDKAAKKQRKMLEKYAKKMAFSKYVKSAEKIQKKGEQMWECCEQTFKELGKLHKHVSREHGREIDAAADDILVNGSSDARWKLLSKVTSMNEAKHLPTGKTPDEYGESEILPWLPQVDKRLQIKESSGQVLLFYTYREIENPECVRKWQEILCKRLGLTGKVRIAQEGLNVTVAGSIPATETYIKAVMAHPLFNHMTDKDFKKSAGDSKVFPDGLKVGVYDEVVPMGVSPQQVSYKDAGTSLSPEEFHDVLKKYLNASHEYKESAVFVDCRNFYESHIGKFVGAIAPNIRKFSYWPEYIEANREFYANKKVFMYCTGGIRCERGSAYLRSNGIGAEVYQLAGGIHKYIEKFPDGYFRGKLFVFDDRYSIQSNEDILSECKYCSKPWDRYGVCSREHCHQLVLSCTECQERGHTACCHECQNSSSPREECQCTRDRPRIPVH